MNGPPPVGNEGIVDIFVLSKNETLAPVIREHMEQNGYQVTLFDDNVHLLEKLKEGKPNLIICDTTDQALPSYDVCRQIKEDRDLWVVPVLILTRAADLSDLLCVLDSNADNFISLPYDLPYLHSLISGMLDTRVERPTPEQIKTQFKIEHDDREFVITADRRKLLEFLLSSFEIAVSRRDQIARSQDQIRSLDQSVRNLESETAENQRAVRAANEKLEQKDQDLTVLRAENKEKDRLIAGKTKETAAVQKELEATSSLLSEIRENLQKLAQEKESAAASYQAEIDTLNEKLAELADALDIRTREYTAAQESLRQTTDRCSLSEKNLANLGIQKEKTDTAFAALAREHAELQESLKQVSDRCSLAEKNLADLGIQKEKTDTAFAALAREHAELQESLKQVSDRCSLAEKNFSDTRLQKEKVETALRNLSHEYDSVNAACRAETARAIAAENETKKVSAQKTEQEGELTRVIEDLKRLSKQQVSDIAAYADALAEAKAHSANLEVQHASLEKEKNLAESALSSKNNELQEQLRDLQVRFSSARAAIEEKETALKSLDVNFAAANLELDKTRENVRLLSAELEETQSALNDEKLDRASRDDEIAGLTGDKEQLSDQVRLLSKTIQEVQSSLITEKEQRRASEDALNSVIREKEAAIRDLRGVHDDVKSNLDLHRSDLVQMRRDLDLAVKARADLEKTLTAAQERIRMLEQEIHSVSAGHAKNGQQVRSLGDELEQVRAALETERRLRHVAEENLKSTLIAHERSSQDLGRLVNERSTLDAAIAAERKSFLEAERAKEAVQKDLASVREKLADMEREQMLRSDEQNQQIRKLSNELRSARSHEKTLEERVEALRNEKLVAENTVSSLSAEIEQARMALADEWGDHMSDRDRLVMTESEKEPPANRAIMVKGPDLPTVVLPSSPPMIIPEESEPDTPGITGVEDLFEDDNPVETVHREDPVTVPETGTDDDSERDSLPEQDSCEDEDDPSGCDTDKTGSDASEDSEGREEDTPEESTSRRTQTGFSFNRTQWFDLLRWSHHSGALSQEQRMQIVRMGRLIQRGRRLTTKQEEQVMEMITLAQTLGYRFS
ncbi:MAG: response regulator [Methanoregula sp.]